MIEHPWRTAAWAVGGAVAMYVAGFDWWAAIVLGIGVAALAVVITRSGQDEQPDRDHERRRHRDGARGDLQDLSWSMVGRDGQVGERALRRVREIGALRLARHGLDLFDPADEERVRALVGERARRTLTRRSAPLPSVPDMRHTLDVLEALGTGRPDPSSDSPTDSNSDRAPAAEPAPPQRRTP